MAVKRAFANRTKMPPKPMRLGASSFVGWNAPSGVIVPVQEDLQRGVGRFPTQGFAKRPMQPRNAMPVVMGKGTVKRVKNGA